MENRWILIIALIVLACMPLQVMAYDNVKAHPYINLYAIDYFERNILTKDPLLADTSIRGEEIWGYEWDENYPKTIGPRDEISWASKKTLMEWIIDGGFSADEPELTMGLVHFYDPKNIKEPWLTDLNMLQEYAAEKWDYNLVNPRISAVDWAFDHDRTDLVYFTQDYSWNDGLRYYKAALESDNEILQYNYGQAWRAVGETMHLISDMTVPAHVRNDGHPPWDGEPYEASVGAWEVNQYRGENYLKTINYDQGTLRDLMERIAAEVNRKFYSADTVPTPGIFSIGYDYPEPSLEGLTADSDGYFYLDGRKLVHKGMANYLNFKDPGLYRLDGEVLDDQREVLIPTAIRASAEVLDRFLPRFEAKLTVEKYRPEYPYDDKYIVHATLKQVRTDPDAWSEYDDLIVRNGAYIIVTNDGKRTEQRLSLYPDPLWVDIPEDPDFNDWINVMSFGPETTTVQIKYDLGGYVITSNEVIIPERPTPTPTRTTATPTTYETTEIVTATPTTAGDTPICGPGGSCEKCCYWFVDEDPDINKAVCTQPWEKDAGIDVGNKYDSGCWQVRAFCSCETGETVDYKSIDTNPWSSLPG